MHISWHTLLPYVKDSHTLHHVNNGNRTISYGSVHLGFLLFSLVRLVLVAPPPGLSTSSAVIRCGLIGRQRLQRASSAAVSGCGLIGRQRLQRASSAAVSGCGLIGRQRLPRASSAAVSGCGLVGRQRLQRASTAAASGRGLIGRQRVQRASTAAASGCDTIGSQRAVGGHVGCLRSQLTLDERPPAPLMSIVSRQPPSRQLSRLLLLLAALANIINRSSSRCLTSDPLLLCIVFPSASNAPRTFFNSFHRPYTSSFHSSVPPLRFNSLALHQPTS